MIVRTIGSQGGRGESGDDTSARARIHWPAFETHTRLGRVRQYLDHDISRPLTLTDAARLAGLNPKYFSAFFHAKVRVRFLEWVHLTRTERAKQLLETKEHSVTAVANLVGYNDLRTFERAFKRHQGVTPMMHRQRASRLARRATSPAPLWSPGP